MSRGRAARLLELVLCGPVLGAAWVTLLTARALSGAPTASPTVSALALAVAFGAAIGTAAELVLAARRAFRRGGRSPAARLLARVVLVAGLHAAALAWGVAHVPALHADALYLSEGSLAAPARTAQVLLADVLGPGFVLVVTALVLAGWAAPLPRDLRAAQRRVVRWMRTRGLVLGPLLAIVLLASLLVRLGKPRKARRAGAPNVVILAVDSLRDDRLAARTAPNLAAFAAQGVRFSRAYVTLPRTLPSWTTILTGRDPHHHGVRTSFPSLEQRARELDALPARLAKLGYASGVVGDGAAEIFTRVRFGFDHVDAPASDARAATARRTLERAVPLLPLLQTHVGRAPLPPFASAMRGLSLASDPRVVSRAAIRMLDRLDDGARPFLLTAFFSTPRFPYAAPAPWHRRFADPSYRGRFKYHASHALGEGPLDEDDVRQVRALYDGAVAAVDDAAARVLEALRARGLDDDTIVIVTADHGELLHDDGHGLGHGDHLFGDHVVHVPLAMKLPSRLGAAAGLVVPDVVRDVDLAPTILDLVSGPASGAPMDGRSLAPLLFGKSLPKRPAFAETGEWATESTSSPLRIPYPSLAEITEVDPRLGGEVVLRAEAEPIVVAAKHRMVIDDERKLVYVPTRKGARWFLFDRAADPAERVDLSASRPADLSRLRSELFRWMLEDRAMEERDGMLVLVAGPSAARRVP